MKILLAHSNLKTLKRWQARIASHIGTNSCILARDVTELVTAYVTHEPHRTFVGGELTFPTVTPDLNLGEPANVFHLSTLAEIVEALSKPWKPPPSTSFDRQTPRLSWWGEGWPDSTEKLRVSAVKNDEAFLQALLHGARLNHDKTKEWAEAFGPFYEAVVAEVTYRLPHGSWKTLSYLQNTSLRLCGAISLYLPQVFETCLPTPLHPRINFISRTPPEHLQAGAKAILANAVNPTAGGMLETLLRAPTDSEIGDGLDEHAQRLLGVMIYLHSTLQAHLAAFDGFLKLRPPEGDWMRTARTVFEFWDLRSFNRASESAVLAWLTQLEPQQDRGTQAEDTPTSPS